MDGEQGADFTADDGQGGVQTGTEAEAPRDFEAEARALGWKPREDYKGDGEWRDAKAFIEHGDEQLPLLKADKKRLLSRLSEMEKRFNKAASRMDAVIEERVKERLEALQEKQLEAVRTGDEDGFKDLSKKIDKIREEALDTGTEPDEAARAEELADWMAENKWYGTDKPMSDYCELIGTAMAKRKGAPLDLNDLATLREKVEAKFPEKFKAESKPAKSPVEGVGTARSNGAAKGVRDLDARGRQLGESMVKMGLFKNLDEYAKDLFK